MYKLLSCEKIFMNTKIRFFTWTKFDRFETFKIFDTAYEKFHYVVDNFSRFNTNSELSKLNMSSRKTIKISEELFKLINFALSIAYKTNGAYDPTIIDFLETYGYKDNPDFKNLKREKLIKKEIKMILKSRHSFKDIKLDKNNFTIKLQKNQKLDLGSVGKGYAIDLAYNEMLILENFLIDAGGDIRARGKDESGKPWLVGLNVAGSGEIGKIWLQNQSICCSGSWARKVSYFHHLINPKTGEPQNEVNQTFVISRTATEADAWSTALFVLGKEAHKYSKKFNIKSFILFADGSQVKNNFPKVIV